MNKHAKELWDKLRPQISDDTRQLELLACACDCYAKIKQAAEIIERDGLLVPSSTGGTKENPAVGTQLKFTNMFQRLLAKLEIKNVTIREEI